MIKLFATIYIGWPPTACLSSDFARFSSSVWHCKITHFSPHMQAFPDFIWNVKIRSSERHSSVLEDGRVVTDFDAARIRSSECHPCLLEDGQRLARLVGCDRRSGRLRSSIRSATTARLVGYDPDTVSPYHRIICIFEFLAQSSMLILYY